MKRIVMAMAVGALLTAGCGTSNKADTAPKATSPKVTTTVAPTSEHDDHDDMEGMDHGHDAEETVADKGLGMLVNGHHETMKYTKLDAATQAKVDHFMDLSREVAAKYPTLKSAHAAGGRNAGAYGPGLGLHVTMPWAAQGLNFDGVIDDEDALHPLIMLYDGTEDDAKVAGFMYYSMAEKKPEGFPGANDFWHYHTNVCTKMGPDGTEAPLGADREVTKEQCDSVGGALMPKTQWMTHVWSVPGYENAEEGGLFAEVNPKLKCSDGTYYIMDAKDWPTHPKNFCKSEL
jgi:hypothetical protein